MKIKRIKEKKQLSKGTNRNKETFCERLKEELHFKKTTFKTKKK